MFTKKIKVYFDKVIDVVCGVILIFIILGIVIGTAQLFITTWKLLAFDGITGRYINIITDVLTLYVMVELSRSLVEFFKSHKLRLTFIVDAAIVFVIRELLIAIFKNEISSDLLFAYSVFLLVLGAIRIGSVLVYLKEKSYPACTDER